MVLLVLGEVVLHFIACLLHKPQDNSPQQFRSGFIQSSGGLQALRNCGNRPKVSFMQPEGNGANACPRSIPRER